MLSTFGGIYAVHNVTEPLSLTATSSKLGGEGMRVHEKLLLTAMSTPPPREALSLRYSVNPLGMISLYKMELDSQVSVTQSIS